MPRRGEGVKVCFIFTRWLIGTFDCNTEVNVRDC